MEGAMTILNIGSLDPGTCISNVNPGLINPYSDY